MIINCTKLKVGDYLQCDLGYGPRSDDQYCKVLEVTRTKGLFGDDVIRPIVRLPDGGEMNHCDIAVKYNVTIRD